MSCDDNQKPPKRKRLNLRCKAAASKDKTIEHKMLNALKDTDSSEDIEKQQTSRSVLKCNNLVKGVQNSVGEEDSTSKEEDVENTNLKSCPVCKYDFTCLDSDFSNLDSDREINEHINRCLDGQTVTKIPSPREHCQICGKDITKYNTAQRQQHINRCCDKVEQTKPEETSLSCPICGKPFKTTKSRQTHMKKCAKENNVSTHQLVQLNRQDKIDNQVAVVTDNSSVPDQNSTKANQDKLGFVKNNKRKRKANLPPVKNLDDDTKLALALSASIRSGAADVRNPGGKRRKKKENRSELPALLLRSDDETKKVTEARAAAILCQWVGNDDDEIQCTPALAPSSLVKKCGYESSSLTEKPEVLLEQIAETDVEDTTERCGSPVIKVRCRSSSKEEEKCCCEKESMSVDTVTTQGGKTKCFTVDTESRLWNLASLRADVITHNGFYVPNLLPKSTPRKKKATKNTTLITDEGHRANCSIIDTHHEDIIEDSLSEVSSQNDGLTESQQNDIEMLVELINDDRSDTQSTGSEEDQSEEIDKTWFPSSGFCVRKDMHETEEQNRKDVETLLNDLSCMIGNPLLSDVEIVAKDNMKFCAHSFMLSARCATLAEILHSSEMCFKDGDSNGLVRLELLDVDVRAVRAVVTYLYTAYFIPVVENILEDVKKLIHRWDLNCNVDQWDVIRDIARTNHEDTDDNEGNLDVLLKTLWEGEDEIDSGNNEEENVFGDSILDDELRDMEIKIYTQETPQKKSRERNQTSAVVLDRLSGKAIAIGERKTSDVVCSSEKQRNLEASVVENEDEPIMQSSDNICIKEEALKLSPSCLPDKNDLTGCSADHDVILVEQSMDDVVETETCPSSGPDCKKIERSSTRVHSSPITKESNSDNLDEISSSPILLPSPSSPVEMMSSPERSPLPDNLDDFDTEDELDNLNQAQIKAASSRKNLSDKNDSLSDLFATSFEHENFPLSHSRCNIDSFADIDISILPPNSEPTSPSLYTSNSKDKEIIIKENATSPRLLKVDSDQRDRSNDGVNTTHGAKQCLVFNSKCLGNEIGVKRHCEDENKTNKNKSDSSLGESSSRFDKITKTNTSSLHSKNMRSTEVQSDAQDHCCDDQVTTISKIIETPRRQLCSRTNKVNSWLDDSPFEIETIPSPKVENNAKRDCCDDTFMTPNANETRQSVTVADKADSWVDAQNNDENFCDDEPFVDCYDDGGFNCDLDDYFTYDAFSSTQDDNLVQEDEKPGTSCSAALNEMESDNNKHNAVKSPKKQDKENGVKKGKKKAGGNVRKPVKNVAGKQNNPHQELKLRDPRTPMLDYSNMATPELQGELKQYGVRPLQKPKMIIKLKEIYSYTHRETDSEGEGDENNEGRKSEIEDEEVQLKDTNSQQGSSLSSCSDSEQNWCEEEQPCDDSEMLSQQSSLNLSETLRSFLTNDHELYFKILKFMPISISDVLETIKENGIQCSAEQLKNFFDEQCITYSEPRPARVQKKRRRRHGKKQTEKGLG